MKPITILLIIALVIHQTWGVFDGRNPGTGPRPGDQFPVTGTLLQCAGEEPGQPLLVGLNVTNPGDVFRPLRSRYRFPASSLQDAGYISALASVMSQLTISQNLQSFNRPPSFPSTAAVLAFPNRYDNTSMDYANLQAICGENVIANLSDSNRNADQPNFWDITTMLESAWLEIYDNLTMEEQIALNDTLIQQGLRGISRGGWISEQIRPPFRQMIEVLSCRVAFRWEDAGASYLPRYFLGGFCLNRNCSMPDRDEFRCHADLSDGETRLLEAARWDCCWTYSRQDGYKYQCGFRKVQFPIVCDCDCRCADKAGT